MSENLVLIVDDEPDIRELLTITLKRMQIKVKAAANLQEAYAFLLQHDFFLCLADMRLPDGDGFELVKHINKQHSDLPVAVITAFGNVEGAVNTLKAGAFDYVSKPIDLAMLRRLVNTALHMTQNNSPSVKPSILGDSVKIKELRQNIKKLARNQAPVFIYGESGSGKELVARAIHQLSPRAGEPFIAINCGAIPSELMESEFFGHKKGSFTGAITEHPGFFAAANGGTLFLDEIAELPLSMQVKLLRAIQEKSIRPVGSSEELPVDVRILSASHKDLQQLVVDNQFRQDLFYRINVITLNVPALREHPQDIQLLSQHILDRLTRSQHCAAKVLSDNAIMALKQYPFPGNVRELENILERALALCEEASIEVSDLQLPNIMPEHWAQPEAEINHLDLALDEQQRQVIIQALEANRWNRTQTAKTLGLSFRQLRYRLKKLDIE